MSLKMFDLSGKVAIVTGARKGLGWGMAMALAGAGADIVGVGSNPMPETKADIEGLGRRFIMIQADLTKPSQEMFDNIVSETLSAFGRVDILVNNSGIIRRSPAIDFTETDWDDVMNVNLKSIFFLSQTVAKQFVKQGEGGKIINIASMLSYQGGINVTSYTSSKSGLMGLTRILANEWAKHGINVNAIAPGYFATDNTQPLQDDPVRNKEILARIPAGKWGAPEDLGGTAVFLASEAANYVHGFCIAVDGGWLAR